MADAQGGGGAEEEIAHEAPAGPPPPRQSNGQRRFRDGQQVKCQVQGCVAVMSPGQEGVRTSNLRYRCGPDAASLETARRRFGTYGPPQRRAARARQAGACVLRRSLGNTARRAAREARGVGLREMKYWGGALRPSAARRICFDHMRAPVLPGYATAQRAFALRGPHAAAVELRALVRPTPGWRFNGRASDARARATQAGATSAAAGSRLASLMATSRRVRRCCGQTALGACKRAWTRLAAMEKTCVPCSLERRARWLALRAAGATGAHEQTGVGLASACVALPPPERHGRSVWTRRRS